MKCNIGEIGVGNDAPEWNEELANGLSAAAAARVVSFTYWAGGPCSGSYPMSIEPDWNTTPPTDAVQMQVVELNGIRQHVLTPH